MSNQNVTLNLTVLNQRGQPLFILESTSQDRALFAEQALAQLHVRAHTSSELEQVDGPSLSELVGRQPQHAGGQTLDELISKE